MTPSAGRSWRAMTYNVRVAGRDGGPDAWPERRDAVASTVRFHRPDVVGLQEPTAAQLADLDARLPGFEFVGVGRQGGDSEGEHTPVGYRTDRFRLDDHATFWLSESPGESGSVAWDAAHPRIVTWARLVDDAGGAVYHFNTHFDHESARARRESARLLRERVHEVADAPAVVTGDLNCTPGSRPHAVLTGGETEDGESAAPALDAPPLADALDASTGGHHGPRTSLTDFASLVEGRKIDYVLVTEGVAVDQHGACTDLTAEGRFPSDHLPLVADLRLRESPRP